MVTFATLEVYVHLRVQLCATGLLKALMLEGITVDRRKILTAGIYLFVDRAETPPQLITEPMNPIDGTGKWNNSEQITELFCSAEAAKEAAEATPFKNYALYTDYRY